MRILLLLSLYLLPLGATSQIQFYHSRIHAEDVNLRQATAVVFDSVTIQTTGPGKVFVKFDGTCTSSFGDRIMLAASHFHGWITNDGVTQVRTIDSTLTTHAFSHTRIFDVPYAYPWTYYAVGHNWVELNGSGIASVDGQLTVMYVPEGTPESIWAGAGFFRGPIMWDGSTFEAKHVTIEVPSSGTLAVSFDGYATMKKDDEIQFTTSLDNGWPSGNNHTAIIMQNPKLYQSFIYRKIYHVAAGTHDIFALARKVQGEWSNNSDYVLATLSVQFIADDHDAMSIVSNTISPTDITNGIPERIGQIAVSAPAQGRIWLQCTGESNSSSANQIRVTLTPINEPDVVMSEVTIQPLAEPATHGYWSLSTALEVEPGISEYEVRAEFVDGSSGSGIATLSGIISAEFIADPVSTGTRDFIRGDEFTVYPNPTPGSVSVKSITGKEEALDTEVRLYDQSGQLILRTTTTQSDESVFDLSELPDGSYIIQIGTTDNQATHKIIKVNK